MFPDNSGINSHLKTRLTAKLWEGLLHNTLSANIFLILSFSLFIPHFWAKTK